MHLFRHNYIQLLLMPARTARRRGYRLREQALKLKQRRSQPKVEVIPQTWVEKIQARRAKDSESVAMRYPPREFKGIEILMDEPEDDVFIMANYPTKLHSIEDAVGMHRELMQPTMYNKPDALLTLRLDLNMQLEKKTKFVGNMTRIHTLPHPFHTGLNRNVIAFARDVEQQRLALDAGASAAGSMELVRQITKGDFALDDVDYAVCHIDMADDVSALKGLLRYKYPTVENGLVGIDMAILTRHYKHGISFDIIRDAHTAQFGICDTVIGKLDQSLEELQANIVSFIRNICQYRPHTEKLGYFVHRAVLMISGSPAKEYFAIPFEEFCPALEKDKPKS